MFFQAIDNTFNNFGIIACNIEVHAGWKCGKNFLFETTFNLSSNGYGIRAPDPDNSQANAGLTIEPRQLTIICQPILNPGYIVQLDATTRMLRYHHLT